METVNYPFEKCQEAVLWLSSVTYGKQHSNADVYKIYNQKQIENNWPAITLETIEAISWIDEIINDCLQPYSTKSLSDRNHGRVHIPRKPSETYPSWLDWYILQCVQLEKNGISHLQKDAFQKLSLLQKTKP